MRAADLKTVDFLIETIAIRRLNMITFFDNQTDLFDLDSAGPEPADYTGKEQLIDQRRQLARPKTWK